MNSKKAKIEKGFIKTIHPTRPDWDYFVPEYKKSLVQKYTKQILFPKTCDRPCTKVITLLPKTTISPNQGRGHYMMNVNGFRIINAYVISDPLNSTAQRGFTLELSFSLNDFVYGVGVIGETSYLYNFETYYDPVNVNKGTIRCETNDRTSTGGLPWIGGTDLTHIARVPVLGPYVRASVFNEDSIARAVEVKAYLMT